MRIQPVKTNDIEKKTFYNRLNTWWFIDNRVYEYYELSWLYNLRWKVTHYLCKTNWVKTNLPVGYYNIDNLMEDALFSLIEGYVSKNGEDAYNSEHEASETIIKILYFYRVKKPEVEKMIESLSEKLYGDNEKKDIKKLDNNYTGDEHDSMFTECMRLKEQLDEETTEILKKCVEIRSLLWS